MRIRKEDKTLYLNENRILFNYKIDTILDFAEYCVVLLVDENIFPDDNVEAYDCNGNKVWNISQIIPIKYPEAYVSLGKVSDALFSVISFNGVRFVIDVLTQKIVNKEITK